MIQIFPISMTQIDWGTYIKSCSESPTRQLDVENIDPKGPFAFLASIGLFKGSNLPTNRIVAGAGFTLRHFSFGFLILCPKSVKDELVSNSDLAIDESHHGELLVTGNLFQWRQAIVQNLQTSSTSTEFRILLNIILGLLEQAGLVDLFRDFSKHPLIDKTFLLTSHKR
jgi:hypothetical protein